MKRSTIARNNDLLSNALRIVHHCRKQGIKLDIKSLTRLTLACHPQNYYLSFSRAFDIVETYRRKGEKGFCNESSIAQAKELYDNVQKVKQRKPKTTIIDAISFTLNFMRPSRFHISEASAIRIIRRHFAIGIICTDNSTAPIAVAD